MAVQPRIVRPLLACVLGLAGVAGCHDGKRAPVGAAKGVNVAQETESAAIRRLFEAAAACGDRYHCPPQDELLARAERPDGTPIAAVAFDLMADPDVRSFDRLGSAAYEAALSWAGARVKAGTFDGQARG